MKYIFNRLFPKKYLLGTQSKNTKYSFSVVFLVQESDYGHTTNNSDFLHKNICYAGIRISGRIFLKQHIPKSPVSFVFSVIKI